jgi:tetratricopeptide (TPR) repeat protein
MARQSAAATDDPFTLTLAGISLANLAGDNSAGLAALDRAIVLNPNCALAFGLRAQILAFVDRPNEAILSAQQAMRLSPLDPAAYVFSFGLAVAHLGAGRYAEALPWADRAFRENGGLPAVRVELSLCGHLGRRAEANEYLRLLREANPQASIANSMRSAKRLGHSCRYTARFAEGLRKAGLPEE